MSMPVNVSGTWSEKARPNNGLERVAEFINGNRLTRVPIVGYVEWHTHGESRAGEKIAVVIPAIEPAIEPDGSDPDGLGAQLWEILDKLRKRAGKGNVETDLFSLPREGFDFDGPGGELDGQQQLDLPATGETRLGPDGPHEVPPPSAAEELAERAEAKAGKAPKAAFSGGAQ